MTYVCGHTPRELARLEIQAAFYEDITRRLCARAGLTAGLLVLDIGCGAGDVSFLVAGMVGPTGAVIGVDRSPEAIATAVARAKALTLSQVTFLTGDIESVDLAAPVDALVGRFVLMHQADPARTLRAAVRHVRPGGVVAFLESVMDGSVPGVHSGPHSPTYDRIVRWQTAVIRACGAHTDMGLRLRSTFLAAGLPAPELRLEARVDGGPDAPTYRYMAESLRSMIPLAEQFGIVPVAAAEVDDLEAKLRQETMATGGVLTSPLVVGAWCRLPAG